MRKGKEDGGRVEMSKEIILEADRFEAKLREMFGFSAQVRANMAVNIRQSRPDSGINKTVKVRFWHI